MRDQDRSLRFYVDQLGFRLLHDSRGQAGERWIAVGPPDGTALLALVTARPGSGQQELIGRSTQIVFVTEDVPAKFSEWSGRGVRFRHPPQTPAWGGLFTTFEDVDGNSFSLVGFDAVTREIEAERRAAAEKEESERRAAQELEIARLVQARLFPQVLPPAATLEYAGVCTQAREVGGDYYDFFELERGRLGLALGDIAGKGIAAALLMANLQANLRSQIAIASDHLQRFLGSVNQLFHGNTTDSAYATLFFATYDDERRHLRYVNCGHPAGLLLHADGSVDRMESTGTVLGLFAQWDCSVRECPLLPGDILALYTDGVTESFDEAGDEYGEERLIAALQRYRELPPQALLASILADVQRFSGQEQHDDITLIAAKVKAI